MDFFDDIFVPSSWMKPDCSLYASFTSCFSNSFIINSNSQENTWVWNLEMDDAKHELFMDKGEPIRFRVERLVFQDAGPLSNANEGKSVAFTVYVGV